MTPEIPYADDVPLIPNVRPVIVVSGSDYDMGCQWYTQIFEIYGKKPLEKRAYRKFTTKELSDLEAYDRNIKKYIPEMKDVLEGMVAGANDVGIPLSYEEVLAKWLRRWEDALRSTAGCSGFAAWGSATKDGKLVCGGSGDHQMTIGDSEILNFEYIVVVFPEKGNSFAMSTSTGPAWHPGMSNKGVAYVHHGNTEVLRSLQEPEVRDLGYDIPGPMMTMHTLRYANTANEAKDIILSLPGEPGGLWADVSGNAFDIENRDNPRCVRKPGDNGEVDFIYSTNNLLSKELGQLLRPPPEGKYDYHGRDGLHGPAYRMLWPEKPVFIPHAGWLGRNQDIPSVTRNLGIWNMLHYYHGEVDIEFAKMMWRFPGEQPSYPTLEEADEAWSKTRGAGWHTKMCNLENAMIGIMQPDDGNEGLYYVSQGCAARITSPMGPGSHYYRIAPTYSFYQLKLDSCPEKVAETARNRAQYDQYYANLELRKLNYGDCAYAPLDAIFNEAATEWQKGEFYRNLAMETKGNESTNYYAKAIRAFARCQALAGKVYNALVPPADSPEDLGLRPWRYWDE